MSVKRDLYEQAVSRIQKNISVCQKMRESNETHYTGGLPKETHHLSKETHCASKETYHMSKETHCASKETQKTSKETCTSRRFLGFKRVPMYVKKSTNLCQKKPESNETYHTGGFPKETHYMSKETHHASKETQYM